MSTYVISCQCGIYRDTRWTYHVDREPTVAEARAFLESKSQGYANTSFVQISKYEPPKVHKI